MATTLLQIRFMAERYIQTNLENETVILWANDAQSDFGVNLSIPATFAITVDTSSLKYALPTDYKSLVRMWLLSDYNNGINVALTIPTRVYGGYIWIPTPFRQSDTLNLDYYKHLKYFTAISDAIDLQDRYAPLYVSYILAQYYNLPQTAQAIGDAQARQEYEKYMQRYNVMKQQVIQLYSLSNPDYEVKARW